MSLPSPAKNCSVALLVPIVCLLIILLPGYGLTMDQTGKCHCFQDRVFDPANRFKSDDYLLTTVGNSLIALHFNISKRQVVMMKMQGGTGNSDLLIGLYLSNLFGADVQDILNEKDKTSWQKLIRTHTSLENINKDPVVTLIGQGGKVEDASRKITHIMLQNRFTVQDDNLSTLQLLTLTPRETALALTLAEHTGVSPELIANQNKENGLSWSEIAHNFGLQPADVGKLVLSPTGRKGK